MNLLPQFSIGITNAFWFTPLFWIGNLIILKAYPSHYKKRVLTMPKFSNKRLAIIGKFNFFLFQGLLFLVLFVPLETQTVFFIPGLLIFAFFFLAYLKSIIDYATSNPEKPVTKGIYRLSRNPQQITTIFMWIGVGLTTNCSLVILVCLLQLLTVYPTFKAQEEFCIKEYGNSYIEYMKTSPRYFLGI